MGFDRQKVATKAKAIVALAFRDGPIEQIHAGQDCPTCTGRPGYSRITNPEMRMIMKNAVDRVYAFLLLRDQDPEKCESQMHFGNRYTANWDEPETPGSRRS